MNYNTFQLTYEAIDQPEKDLEAALREQRIPRDRFVTLSPGESIPLPKPDGSD